MVFSLPFSSLASRKFMFIPERAKTSPSSSQGGANMSFRNTYSLAFC